MATTTAPPAPPPEPPPPGPPIDPARRQLAAGHVVVALLVALVLAALLNGGAMHTSAQIREPGWERDVSLALTRPLAWLSGATLLDRPREALGGIGRSRESDAVGDPHDGGQQRQRDGASGADVRGLGRASKLRRVEDPPHREGDEHHHERATRGHRAPAERLVRRGRLLAHQNWK